MTYRIAQDFEYIGNDYWRWWAWIEAEDIELDKVEEVVWILHPSFKRPRVVTTQRSDKFQLKTAGWGTFLLRAEVRLADGKTRQLKHNVELEYPDTSATVRSPRSKAGSTSRPTIYLSYSSQDSRAAAKLRTGLDNAGLEVLDQTRLGPGEPWSETLQRMIAQSDAIIGLVGEDEISPWVSAEIKSALASSKPSFVLFTAGASNIGLPSEVRTLRIDQFDPMKIADMLRSA